MMCCCGRPGIFHTACRSPYYNIETSVVDPNTLNLDPDPGLCYKFGEKIIKNNFIDKTIFFKKQSFYKNYKKIIGAPK